MKTSARRSLALAVIVLMIAGVAPVPAEVILQYFNTSWNGICRWLLNNNHTGLGRKCNIFGYRYFRRK